MTLTTAGLVPSLGDDAVSDAIDLLLRGYNSLYASAHETGHWPDARSTALGLMACHYVEAPTSPWLAPAVKTLCKWQQKDSGAWNDEIWDTAMAVIALKTLYARGHPAVTKGLAFIDEKFSAEFGNWHNEPWETCWALLAYLLTGTHQAHAEQVQRGRTWLAGLQESAGEHAGRLIASHYTAYYLLIEEIAVAEGLPAVGDRDAAKMHLLHPIAANRLWTDEGWSNGQILWCMARAGVAELADVPRARTLLQHLSAMPPGGDGGWADAEDTASVVLGLSQLLTLAAVDEAPQQTLGGIERSAPKAPPLFEINEFRTVTINITARHQAYTATAAAVVVGLVKWQEIAGKLSQFGQWIASLVRG